MSKIDLILADLKAQGVDEFCRRRWAEEGIPIKIRTDDRSLDLFEGDLPPGWTARRMQTLILIASGFQDKEIAERMVVSVHTVKDHVGWVLVCLGARSRAHAVHLAHQLNLIE